MSRASRESELTKIIADLLDLIDDLVDDEDGLDGLEDGELIVRANQAVFGLAMRDHLGKLQSAKEEFAEAMRKAALEAYSAIEEAVKRMGSPKGGEVAPKYPHIVVRLIGGDGNAFSILARVNNALFKAGVSNAERERFRAEAQSADYDNLLRTVMRWVTVK